MSKILNTKFVLSGSKNKRKTIGATIKFPEDLENTPFNFKMGQTFNGKQMAFQSLSTYLYPKSKQMSGLEWGIS